MLLFINLVAYQFIFPIFVPNLIVNNPHKNDKTYGKSNYQSYEEFEKLVGQQIGVSDYVELSQERINLFADATLDHQWIHVDTERAKVDSPYHSTIAHGYLTLSMLPYLWNQIIQVNNLK